MKTKFLICFIISLISVNSFAKTHNSKARDIESLVIDRGNQTPEGMILVKKVFKGKHRFFGSLFLGNKAFKQRELSRGIFYGIYESFHRDVLRTKRGIASLPIPCGSAVSYSIKYTGKKPEVSQKLCFDADKPHGKIFSAWYTRNQLFFRD